jgi:hypothetical protein
MWTYNSAIVFVGGFTDGTNEYSRTITCSYKVVEGNVNYRNLGYVRVRGTGANDDPANYKLRKLVIYPTTDIAIVDIVNSKGTRRIKLLKVKEGKRVLKASL